MASKMAASTLKTSIKVVILMSHSMVLGVNEFNFLGLINKSLLER